ncbi:MAG TPA: PKD domain-containing protein, partial [Cytophagaceae bacterium]
ANTSGALRITIPIDINYCIFSGNESLIGQGGALTCFGKSNINNSRFESNKAVSGGAIASWDIININNCIFKNNMCSGENEGGGAIFTRYAWFFINNCLFEGNLSTGHSGGAIFLNTIPGGAPIATEIRNSTFVKNHSTYESNGWNPGEVISGYSKLISNCIFWGNGPKAPLPKSAPANSVTFSNIQGGHPGTGNLDVDPKFVDFEGGDYRLSCSSPLINKGSNQYVTTTTDLDNNPRIFAGTVDIGAYEFPQDPVTVTAPPQVQFTVNSSACRAEQISFQNNTTPFENIRFEWDFGDGTSSQLASPTHSYLQAATYTVTLKATNACGASAQTTQTINILPTIAPTISYATLVCPGEIVEFTTDASCSNLDWSVEGGTIQGGNGTYKITVLWGDGANGNGRVTLNATGCGSGFCESPVSIEIPIVPVNFELQGPVKVCQGSMAVYETRVKDATPSTLYTWNVTGGTIVGARSGYNINTINVQWGNTDTVGVVYLTTYNEMLHCGRTDSFIVKIRPTFSINGDIRACEGNTKYYTIVPAQNLGAFTWSVTGNNSVNNTTGEVNWGNISGTYYVIAEAQDLDKVCNAYDSLEVELFNNPQLFSITGETEVDPNSNHIYTVDTDASGLQFNWIATGGTVINKYGNKASITWGNSNPYQLIVSATVSDVGCLSNTLTLNVDTNFVYRITGPDTLCIGSTADLTANTDPLSPTVYSWSSGMQTTQELDNVYKVTFDMPGTQIISLSATRKGKVYSAFKSVYVKAAVTDIAITGPKDIDPQGTGTYTYTIINSQNIQYDLNVIGAANYTKNGNEVIVTWGGNEPFIITAQGIIPGDACKGVPAKLEVKKVKMLSDQINALGIPCLNSIVKYSFAIDEYTSNVEWSISGGGTIVSNTGNEIEVEWTSLGNYTLTVQYERFGAKTSSLNVSVLSLPSPQINDATICGDAPLSLSTTSAYAAYKWFLEPNTAAFSTSAQPLVNTEGLYRVEVTGANGCSNFTSKYIKQIPLPKANIFTNDPTGYCVSPATGTTKTISLKTFEGQDYQYQWYKDNQPIAGATTPVYTFNLPIDKASSATYTVKVTLETCSETSKPISVSAYSCTGNGGNCTEPLVSFNVNSIEGCQPFTFENLSTEEGDFGWNFGDGTYSNAKNPSPKSYNDAGIFTVTLTRKCQFYQTKVEVPAVALFKLDEPGCKGQALKFNDLSVNIPGLPIESWLWDFGDGNTLQGSGTGDRDATHIFSNTGTYLVKLTVNARNSQGKLCSHTFEKSIDITEPPVADFTTIAPPCTDNTFRFADKSIFTYSTARYLWDFGNGQTATLTDPSQKFAAGNYNVQLTVTDLLGCTGTKSTSINVTAPVAVDKITLTGDTVLCDGKTVTLTSPAGNSYVWRKDGVVVGGNTQSISPNAAGSYTVTYNTSDCDVTTAPIKLFEYQVENLLSGSQKACVGDPLVINSNLDPSKYSFSWKRDTSNLTYNNATLIINDTKPDHAGSYYLTVTDKKNACMLTLPPYDVTVYEKPVKPIINASLVQACYGGSVTLQSNIVKSGKTIVWYKEQELLTGTDSLITIANITSGANYTVKVTEDTTGCSIVSDRVFVNVGPDVQVQLSGDTNVCELSPISISTGLSLTDYTFEWYRSGNVLQANGAKLSIANVALADSGIYYVKVTSSGTNNITGCTAYSDTLHLTVKPAPVKPVITGPASFCSGSSITLSTNLTENYSWSTGAVTNSINVTLGGVYSVTSRNPVSGCEITAFANITENPLPDLSFFPKGVYERCASDKIVFEGLNQYPQFNWYVDGTPFSASNNLYPTKSGNYTLRVVSDSGCVAWSDTARITSLECPCYVTNTNDSGLGSLREAIECANSKPGKDVIKFVIEGTGPFIIQPLTALPKIIDSVFIDGFSQSGSGVYDIILDGTNYSGNALTIDYNIGNSTISGLTFRNYKNAISLSSFVTNTNISKNKFHSISESAVKLENNTTGNVISENTIESSGLAIALVASSNLNTIEKNVIDNSKIGVGIFQNSRDNIVSFNEITNSDENGVVVITGSQSNLIKANTIGSSTLNGIYLNSKAKQNIIDSNYIGVTATGVNMANGKSGIHVADTCDGVVIVRNVIGNNAEHGIYVQSKNVTISSNYIGTSKNGAIIANNKYGVYSEADSSKINHNQIANNLEYGIYVTQGSSIVSNTIKNNIKGGIYVQVNGNKISRNTITNTNPLVKAIDLHLIPGPGGNDGKMPATFTKYRRSENGIVLKGTALPNDTVEVFVNNNVNQQALLYAGSAKADASGVWELEIIQGTSFDPNKKNYFVNTATNSGNNTSELSDGFMTGCFTCICTVTNTNDSGDGSLRAKVDSANTGSCLTINFDIATPDSITLQSPITNILVPVAINGTQGGMDPLIKIKGNGIFNAFNIPSDGVSINHLTLSEFKNAITVTGDHNHFDHVSIIKTGQPITIAGNNNVLTSSGINTNLSHQVNFAADTLIYITGSNNQLGKLNEGNKVVGGQQYGILVSNGKSNSILYNAIYDNKVAIAHVNNGNELLSAPNTLVGSLLNGVASVSGKAKENSRVQLFFSSYDPEQAFGYALEVYADASGNWNAIIPAGLFTPGQNNYFVATATDQNGNTSPLSALVRIGDFIQVCYVTNTLNEGKGSLRDAVHCANVAGTGTQGVGAKIVFQLPETQNEILINSGYTITNNYGVQINPFHIPVAVKAQTPDFAGFTWATNNLQIK